jgi:hypothetical protein
LVDAFLRDPDNPRTLMLAAIPDCVEWFVVRDSGKTVSDASEGDATLTRSHWQEWIPVLKASSYEITNHSQLVRR